MKKITLIMALFALAFVSCNNDMEIIRKLTDNEAAIIPYSLGNSVTYVDHNSDTVTLVVESDVTEKFDSDYFPIEDNIKTSVPRFPDCYGRSVKFCDIVYNNAELTLVALPDSLLVIDMVRKVVGAEPEHMYICKVLDLKTSHADSITIEGTTYHNVYITNNPHIIYSCTDGMLLLKTDNCLYTKVQ